MDTESVAWTTGTSCWLIVWDCLALLCSAAVGVSSTTARERWHPVMNCFQLSNKTAAETEDKSRPSLKRYQPKDASSDGGRDFLMMSRLEWDAMVLKKSSSLTAELDFNADRDSMTE